MNKLFFGIFMTLALSACETTRADDFSVSGSAEKTVSLDGISSIDVYCYCPDGFQRRMSSDRTLTIDVGGTHDSVGYHGHQEKPDEVGDELLSFTQKREGSKLILRSKEYQYIHHAFILDLFILSAPEDVSVTLYKLSRQDLIPKY